MRLAGVAGVATGVGEEGRGTVVVVIVAAAARRRAMALIYYDEGKGRRRFNAPVWELIFLFL